MKVCLFVEDITFGGGLEIVTDRLCTALINNGIDASIISIKRQFGRFESKNTAYNFNFANKKFTKQQCQEIIHKIIDVGYTHLIFQASYPFSYFLNIGLIMSLHACGIKLYAVFHTSPKNFLKRFFYRNENPIIYALKLCKTIIFNKPRSFSFFKKSKPYITNFISISSGMQSELKKYYDYPQLT